MESSTSRGVGHEVGELHEIRPAQEVAQQLLVIARQVGRVAHHLEELLGGELGRAQLEAILEIAAHDARELDEEGVHLAAGHSAWACRAAPSSAARQIS